MAGDIATSVTSYHQHINNPPTSQQITVIFFYATILLLTDLNLKTFNLSAVVLIFHPQNEFQALYQDRLTPSNATPSWTRKSSKRGYYTHYTVHTAAAATYVSLHLPVQYTSFHVTQSTLPRKEDFTLPRPG